MAKKESASVVDASTYGYDTTKVRGKDGKSITTRGNGDAIAMAFLAHKMLGGDLDQVIKANKLEDKFKPHMKKSEGMKRMTLAVILRGLVRNDTPVKIGKIVVEKLNQKIELPKFEDKAAPRARKRKVAEAA